MSTPEQPRDDAGRFASYVRPPVPASRPRHQRVTALVELPAPAPVAVVRRLTPEVPVSVVAVCCPECVYGVQA